MSPDAGSGGAGSIFSYPGVGHTPEVPRIAIALDTGSGHRLMYLTLLFQQAERMGIEVCIVAPHDVDVLELAATHWSSQHHKICVHHLRSYTYDSVLDWSSEAGVPRVVFLNGDEQLWTAVCSRRQLRTSATVHLLVMRRYGQHKNTIIRTGQTILKKILRTSVRLRRGLHVFTLVSSTSRRLSASEVRDPVTFSPDAAMTIALRADWENSTNRRYWFGVVGVIDERKNIHLIAKAISLLPQQRVGLVIAGHCQNDNLERWLLPLRRAGIPVVQRLAHLSEMEIDSTIAALDCVVVAHSNEGPSGILGKGVHSAGWVLAAGADTLRADARRCPSTVKWTPLRVHALTRAMHSCMQSAAPPRFELIPGGFADRLLDHESSERRKRTFSFR